MLRKFVGGAVLVAFVAVSHAANVTWQPVKFISGPSDVSTQGTYVGSWAPYIQITSGAVPMAVNGVTFQGNDLQGFSVPSWFTNQYGGFGSPGTSDANYNALLGAAQFGNDGAGTAFTFGGLTAGHEYLVQIWAEDTRDIKNRRWENFYGDEGQAGQSGPVAYPADGSSPDVGQFVIGTFTANAAAQTISQDTWAAVSGHQSGQVNLFQVRDITAVPEPGTIGLLAAGAVLTLARPRRR